MLRSRRVVTRGLLVAFVGGGLGAVGACATFDGQAAARDGDAAAPAEGGPGGGGRGEGGAGGDAAPFDAAAPADASWALDCDGAVLCTGFDDYPGPWETFTSAGPGTLAVAKEFGGTFLQVTIPDDAGAHDHGAAWHDDEAFTAAPDGVRLDLVLAVDAARLAGSVSGVAELVYVRLGEEDQCAYASLVLGSNHDLRASFSSSCSGGIQQVTVPLGAAQGSGSHRVVLDMPSGRAAPRVRVDDGEQAPGAAPLARVVSSRELLVKVGAKAAGSRPAYGVRLDQLVVHGW